MEKLYQISCPKCNNKTDFYRYGKDPHGHQKYLCKKCRHQWAPDTPERVYTRTKNYPSCPFCGKAMYLHHDKEHYARYTCCDKKCNHSLVVPKPTAVSAPSMSNLFGKTNFKRMRYPVHVILMALSHVLSGQKLVPQYRSHFAYRDECPGFPHYYQQLVYQLRPYVPEYCFTAHSGPQFQL